LQRTMVYLMALQRRGLTQRFIALLTAAAMPLCCCVINAGASCCAPNDETPIVEVQSCCSNQQCNSMDEEATTESPCSDSNCSCCLKAPANTIDWTPPVDTIGTALPPFALGEMSTAIDIEGCCTTPWDDPPPKSGGVDSLRGHVILQV
jgi:hypothetical protein